MLDANFWQDKSDSQKTIKEKKLFEDLVNSFKDSATQLKDLDDLYTLATDENNLNVKKEVMENIRELRSKVKKNEIKCFLSKEADSFDCYVEIHAGAGGTESQDWANMLRRMYMKWSDNKNHKCNLISEHKGEEAGIKSSTIKIEGDYVFGWLKKESGIHRLVRISPFDSGARRHTSFASVFAYPEVDETIEINIDQSEISWETFRASGAGGQSVNKIESAVRLKHKSSGLIIECQQERSQILNKEKAMKMLKSKLYQIELEKVNKEKDERDSKKLKIDFGSQIRNYVLHPYKMIKDVRTNIERGDVNNVLDGDINDFIKGFLLMSK